LIEDLPRCHFKLIPPRQDKTPNWSIAVEPTSDNTLIELRELLEKKIAQKELKKIERDIECGRFAKPVGPTFNDAALKYLKLGKDNRFIDKLVGLLWVDVVIFN